MASPAVQYVFDEITATMGMGQADLRWTSEIAATWHRGARGGLPIATLGLQDGDVIGWRITMRGD